jgi:ACS family hexuronate transporter-like MFS transporter
MTVDTKTIGKYRYRILALIFLATTINYLDRSILGVLGPTLRDKVFHWSNSDYALINVSFKLAYAFGLLFMGSIIDKVGVRLGYTISIAIWSVFGIMHALVQPAFSLIGFITARFGLGFGESGNFPAAIKTVAEWFPKKDRAFATGIFNAGSNVGAILAPLIIPLVVNSATGENWQFAFLVSGTFSAIWVFLWWRTYRLPQFHPKVTKAELDYIEADSVIETPSKVKWSKLFRFKQTWAFSLGKLTDAAWWFYLFWATFFLTDKFHLQLSQLALPMIVIYVMADIGSIGGGWISKFFMNQGWTLNKARKVSLLICVLFILPVCFATQSDNPWVAIILIAFAAAGHQAWSANLFTVVSDVFPKKAVASVVGIGGLVGALAGVVADLSLGKVLDDSGPSAYFFAFLFAGLIYVFALIVIQIILPRLDPVNEKDLE